MTTPQRRKMYEFINQHIEEHGYSPSFKEIAKGIGLSESSVSLISRNVQALIKAGWLTHQAKGSRRSVIPAKSNHFSLPLLGRIAAGSPIEAVLDDHFVDLSALFKGNNHFMLEVKGDSMIEEKIFDGDLVICKCKDRAEEGEIIAVLIDQQEVTLKRISYQLKGMVTLIPANENLKPKAYPPHRIQIQGVFIATLRFKK
jgi:repressor LexA